MIIEVGVALNSFGSCRLFAKTFFVYAFLFHFTFIICVLCDSIQGVLGARVCIASLVGVQGISIAGFFERVVGLQADIISTQRECDHHNL